ncbi:TPA_exp: putative Signal peptide peptidase [Trichophyton benhamiae CBS 112371]|uniref:Signal peptide peptidase, putative n=1 Tax=Arthroderma benhamiae (strain ATCC MYA-4681 / CBS 112371) TaxID=663331 RepID=D4B0N1_ARTBC|nr:signal peptide peptidase, putative [Trichophyton benhamiae CBS 112371]EFE31138.1 signal peptide peptidase, putative [Trichophyton benhamiae CBS 112371]DAA74319.1 TPA_exp: putative Signal peptide peptidase [Trichophyton benhamiae CBS 112371]
MHPLPSLTEAIDQLTIEFALLKPLIPTYTHLIISTLFALYIGCHASLSRPSSAKKESKEHREEDDTDEAVVQKMGGLEPSDAIVFPVLSGLTLSGLYLLIKNFDPKYLSKILNWYFSHTSFIFGIAFFRDAITILRSFAFPTRYFHRGTLWKANQEKRVYEAVASEGSSRNTRPSPLPGILGTIPLAESVQIYLWSLRGTSYQKLNFQAYIRSLVDLKFPFNIIDVLSIIFSGIVVQFSAFGLRPWWLTNFLGFCFSYGALQFMSPTTFWTGTLILSSLFFYDIFFVFYTPMMVTVATKLDIPIKLVFPRPPVPGESKPAEATLGLGDIVVPGMIIGLALRFDLYLYYLRKQSRQEQTSSKDDNRVEYKNAAGGWGERAWGCGLKGANAPRHEKEYFDSKSFPKTYFTAGLIGYAIGIVATLLSMQLSQHPQPALLFLVPGVLISLWGTAFAKGDIQAMWNFSDEVEDEGSNEDETNTTEANDSFMEEILKKTLSFFWDTRISEKDEKSAADAGDSSRDSSSESPDRDGNKDSTPSTEDNSSEEKRTHSKSELISLSISLITETESKKELGEGKLVSTPQPSTNSSPILVAKEEERPLKKRRGYKPTN